MLVNDFSKNIPAYSEGSLSLADISTIARGQRASEEALARQANKILFVGADLKAVAVLSRKLFGDCPTWVEEEAAKVSYDLYLDVNDKFERAIEAIHAAWPSLSFKAPDA